MSMLKIEEFMALSLALVFKGPLTIQPRIFVVGQMMLDQRCSQSAVHLVSQPNIPCQTIVSSSLGNKEKIGTLPMSWVTKKAPQLFSS